MSFGGTSIEKGMQTYTFYCVELEEDGVRIALTIVDTPGFGDNIDNEFAYVTSLQSMVMFFLTSCLS
jgi:septin family protein